MAGNVSDAFYYLREQAKFRAGDLEGAQKDISSAIILDPQNAIYYAEEASIYLRRQQPDKAQESLQKAISIDPDFASSHRLLGVSYLRQEKKDEACKAFQKAKELGDPVVDKLIRENCQ
jgi:tetratricopeptide (TPR) repeat protein